MNYIFYTAAFTFTFLSSIVFTLAVKKIATGYKVFDYPVSKRKIHTKKIPLLGGMAVFLSFFLTLLLFRRELVSGELDYSHWLFFFFGGVVLMIGGFLDDKYNLSPGKQIIFPVLAIFAVLLGQIGIEKITDPRGGFLYFNKWSIPFLDIGVLSFSFVVLADLITFAWLMTVMYTTKLLDGLDGLVAGVSAIGGIVIFLFTMTTQYYQPDIGITALIFAAACLGFLVFNWHPAKIFLGEGGSLFLGYVLGVLAIISGGKIAIALLVLGLPLMDLAWTVIRRLSKGGSPFRNDKKHLHHRLLGLGLGQRRTVLIFYFFALSFGLSALFLQTIGKFLAIGLLFLIMLALVLIFNYWKKV